MITITQAAAAQIQKAAEQAGMKTMLLRLAIKIESNGSFEYGMGFDERKDSDILWESSGVSVLVSPSSKDLLTGATLDFVELNPGEHQFIFTNPNDPAHRAPPRQSS